MFEEDVSTDCTDLHDSCSKCYTEPNEDMNKYCLEC